VLLENVVKKIVLGSPVSMGQPLPRGADVASRPLGVIGFFCRLGMTKARAFLPQHAVDAWLAEGRVEVADDVLILRPEGARLKLRSAIRVLREVTGAEDVAGLLHKIKDLGQIADMGGEHYGDSLIVGDAAYEVAEGFAAEPEGGVENPSQSGAERSAPEADPLRRLLSM
jgi:hypothetical protein